MIQLHVLQSSPGTLENLAAANEKTGGLVHDDLSFPYIYPCYSSL